MPQYDIVLCEERFYFTTVTVTANNEREAHGEALAQGVSRPPALWKRDGGRGVGIVETRRR